MNKDIKICFMGTPTFGRIVLEKLIEEYSVVLVVSQPDSFTNGKRKQIIPEVKKLALEYNIPIFQPESIKDDFSEILKYEFDFLVTASYGQFIPQAVLNLPRIMTLNVHGSNLPKYRGGAPIQRAIENGDEYLGVSIMKTVLKMDAGRVYHKSLIKLEDDDNYETMTKKLALKGREDLCQVIDMMFEGTIVPYTIQDIDEVTFAKNIKREEELLDFSLPAHKLFNKIRAFNPNPLTYFLHDDVMYKVYKSRIIKDDSNCHPNTILENDKTLIIKCGIDALEILEIKPQGKSKMDIKSFMNGYRTKFQKLTNI